MNLYAALITTVSNLIVPSQDSPTPFEVETTAEAAAEKFLETNIGRTLQGTAWLVGICVVGFGIWKGASSMFGRGGGMGGGVGQALKPLMGALLVAGLLWNLQWPFQLVSAIARAAVSLVDAVVNLIPGVQEP